MAKKATSPKSQVRSMDIGTMVDKMRSDFKAQIQASKKNPNTVWQTNRGK